MKIIDTINIAISSNENLSKEKRDECIEYISNLNEKIEKVKKLIEVDTYTENIYLGLCYLFGEYNYEDLPTKIKKVLDNENDK